jgi:hypothetical protein
MPTPTYVSLATITLSSATNTVTFSSIPATYRDLVVIINGNTSTTSELQVNFNADGTAGNYSTVRMSGDAGAGAASATSGRWIAFMVATGVVARQNVFHQIFDYSATDKHKTALFNDDRGSNSVLRGAQRWANNNAVTSLTYNTISANFIAGTTLSLYGIAA